ncbi:MAG: aldehyde dehydrogenase family protein [Nitrospinaceae bacterium]
MTKKYEFLIGGTWHQGSRTLPVVNPYTQEVFGEVCLADGDAIEKAIVLAEKAFQTTRKQPAYLRGRICSQVAEGIRSRSEEFARTLARESGKPLVLAQGEVQRSISTFTIASEEALRINGEVLTLDISESARGKTGITWRFPIGPVAGISPFNFPLNLIAHKVAPALACGNPIIIKPASATPLTALLLAEVVLETEAVEGSFSVLPCSGKVASPLVEDPRIKMISFTGSVAVGWDMKRRAGKKKVTLELGGNAAVIVEPDADLDLAAKKICSGAFAYSGQVCISVQRCYVHESRFSPFMDRLLKEVNTLQPGDPLDETVNFGPMIDVDNAKRIETWTCQAVEGGGRVLTGGKRDGAFFEPTVLTGVPANADLACNEAFGPILVVEPYSDFRKALDLVNNSDYGLQAGVFTPRMDKSLQAFNRLEVGGVIINDVPTFRVDNMPYGGVKDSGFGREGIRYSLEEMTEIKLLAFDHYREE